MTSVRFVLNSSFGPSAGLKTISERDGCPNSQYMATVMPQHKRHTNAAIADVLRREFRSRDTIELANKYSSPSSGSVSEANVRVPLI